MIPGKLSRRLAVLVASCALGLLALEVLLRLLVSSSAISYGKFLGHELPPVAVIPDRDWEPESRRDDWHEPLIVDGKKITSGDLWGFHREDPDLGYTARESSISVNGWWQSNSIGARERSDPAHHAGPGTTRLLVFGDSYAQGSRVPQEEAWPELLEADTPGLEVINLGVDGYGMGQSFLRYRGIRGTLEHDVVLLAFVPIRDLWRDINVLRTLGEDWDFYVVMPRFVVERGRLVLVPSPYENSAALFEQNRRGLSPELERHLERYDRFYFAGEHRAPGFWGGLVAHKVLSEAYYEARRRRLRDSRLEPGSEALAVSTLIFRTFDEEVRRDGKRFVLVFLPSERDLVRLAGRGAYRRNWRAMVEAMCGSRLACIDLAEPLLGLPAGDLDRGYDGTHFGPRANARIARMLGAELERLAALAR